MTMTPIVLFVCLSNANPMYDYFHDAPIDTQINNQGYTNEKMIPSITVAEEEEEESDEDEDDEEEGEDYSLEEGEDNDGYFYEDVEKDFDEETCQEYIHARQLGHLCSDDKEYMLLAKDKAFKSHLNNKTTKITLYHACSASCKSYVTDKFSAGFDQSPDESPGKSGLCATKSSTGTKIRSLPSCGRNMRSEKGGRIVGGREVHKHSIPWQVGLVKRKGEPPSCGGMIITHKVVLTAAHCVDLSHLERLCEDTGICYDQPMYVASKEHNFREPTGKYHKICHFRSHPKWNSITFENDFALLYLKDAHKIDFCDGRANCIALPKSYMKDISMRGYPLRVSGWGLREGGRTAAGTGLRAVLLRGMDNRRCHKKLMQQKNIEITRKMLCAKSRGADSCQGDSGGPLTYTTGGHYGRPKRTYAIGVVSFGAVDRAMCGKTNYPGVYAKVAGVLRWIKHNMHKQYNCP